MASSPTASTSSSSDSLNERDLWSSSTSDSDSDDSHPFNFNKKFQHVDSYFQWYPTHIPQDLTLLIGKLDQWESDLEECLIIQISVSLTHKMLRGFYATIEGRYAEAEKYYDGAEIFLENEFSTGLNVYHFEAFNYLLTANRAIYYDKAGMTDTAMTLLSRIQKTDLDHALTQAALLAMKAIFTGHMGMKESKLGLLREVVDLDPEHLDWLHFYYRALRTVRRERQYNMMPADEEIEVCRQAYALNSYTPGTIFDFATLLDDMQRSHHMTGATCHALEELGIENIEKELLYLANRAVEVNPESIRANVRLAEVYSYSKIPEFQARADVLFQKCLKSWPNSSEVLHKVGKYYCSKKNNSNARVQGLSYMAESLVQGLDNYPCLMDYIKAHMNFGTPFSRIVDIIHNAMPEYSRRFVLKAKLDNLRAIILWQMGDRIRAVDFWLEAAKGDPGFVDQQNLWPDMSGLKVYRQMNHWSNFKLVLDTIQSEMILRSEPVALRVKFICAMHRSFDSHKRTQAQIRARRQQVREDPGMADLSESVRRQITIESIKHYNGDVGRNWARHTHRPQVFARPLETFNRPIQFTSIPANDDNWSLSSKENFGLPSENTRVLLESLMGNTSSVGTSTPPESRRSSSSSGGTAFSSTGSSSRGNRYPSDADLDDNWRSGK